MAVITYEIPSERIVHETRVDFSYRSVQKPIHIVQYDKQLPIIAVSLYVSGKTYTLPANFDVNVKFGKRDRTFIYKPVLGCNDSRNVVYFEVDEQMSFLHGPVNPILELSFIDGEEPQRAGSSSIAIEIDRNPIQESDIESYSEYMDLSKAYVSITYAELVSLKNNESLKKGSFYRITDYETTTVQVETQSAGHLFDIIVQALDEKTLSENAQAIHRKKELLPWFEHNQSDYPERFFYVDSVVIEGLTLYRWVSYEELNNDDSPSQYLLTEKKDVGVGDVVWGYQLIDDGTYENTSSDYEELVDMRIIINVGQEYMSGQDYFDNSKLEAWKLKYSLNNDTSRFAWADEVNGKGVIYRMIDEFGNDLPYDFKNIQFKRYKIVEFSENTELENRYYALKKLNSSRVPYNATVDYNDFIWAYTFTVIDEDGAVNDVSLNKNKTFLNEDDRYNYTKNNKIGSFDYTYYDEIEEVEKSKEALGNNVMLYDYDYYGSWVFYGFYSNTIGNNFNSNTIGSGFYSNTIGNNFNSNTIGSGFEYNTIDNQFGSNTVGNYFNSNTIGNYFYDNTVDNGAYHNTVGNYFNSNTIGNQFGYNTVGNYFNSNTISNQFRSNTVGNSISYIRFSVNGTNSNIIRNLYIKSGLTGASYANRLDLYYSGLYHRLYPTTIERIANGNIVSIHQETPFVWTGKKKISNISSIWHNVPETEGNYVRFVSASPRTITPKYTNSGVTLQYSVDGGDTWTTISSGASTTSATEHWFRGQATGTKRLFTSSMTSNRWMFSGSSDLEVYGNLNFLLCDTLGDEVAPTSLGTNGYAYMFYSCTSLTSAPELPATTLRINCYNSMFQGCTSLTTAPELPATTLASGCYNSMFRGCTSLTTAPELPATTLTNSCYSSMFQGCTSLTTAPELPATTLTDYCYSSMFSGCTSLTTVPELPATTLRNNCYSSMFSGCTSLISAPELPATTLTTSCYNSMFNGCTSLILAPELPATTLADYCYNSMFQGCTSLTTAPELPATNVADHCYSYMFRNCTSFKVSATNTGSYIYPWRIPTSGTGTTATNWNVNMLANTGGTFTSNPDINTTYYVENEPV